MTAATLPPGVAEAVETMSPQPTQDRRPSPLHDLDLHLRAKVDPAAMAELVQACLPFLTMLRKRYLSEAQLAAMGWSHEDAFQVAALGFIKAVRMLDPTRGNLGTFAGIAVKGELWTAWRRASEVTWRATCSLEQPLGDDLDGNTLRLVDVLADEGQALALEAVLDAEERANEAAGLRAAIAGLRLRQRQAVVLVDLLGQRQDQAAAAMRCTQSYVSRCRLRGLRSLRRALAKQGRAAS